MVMTERRLGILAGCIFVIVGAVAFMVALTIPRRMPVGIDSGVLPEIFSAALFACGVLLAAPPRSPPTGTRTPTCPTHPSRTFPPQSPRGLALFLNIVLIVGYVVSLPYLGFIISSAIFFFLQLVLLDGLSARGLVRSAVFAVVATAVIWLLFDKGFGLLLPAGILG